MFKVQPFKDDLDILVASTLQNGPTGLRAIPEIGQQLPTPPLEEQQVHSPNSSSSFWSEESPLTDHAYLRSWGASKQAFVTDHALLSPSLSQAVVEHLSATTAPPVPLALVLPSLLLTASIGVPSPHFHWRPDTQLFNWDSVLLGWTAAASSSAVSSFLLVGSLQRRLESRLAELRAIPRCKEVHCLAFALESVLAWLKTRLGQWADLPYAGILNAASQLQGATEVLEALAALLTCEARRMPPFKPLLWLDSSKATLSHVHTHLLAAFAAQSHPLARAVLAYLLDRTSLTWRNDVAAWIGWPGAQRLEPDHSIPWCGAEMETSLDERGEEDVGYTLRVAEVPSFVGIREAREMLEAGRAIRLLAKASPGHALVQSAAESLKVATWFWDTDEAQRMDNDTDRVVQGYKRRLAGEHPIEPPPLRSESMFKTEDRLAAMTRMFDALPTESDGSSTGLEDFLGAFLLADPMGLPPLLHPFSKWTKLVHTSLITVFFRDLGLATYLETCQRFLLLGDHHFRTRVCTTLLGATGRGLAPPSSDFSSLNSAVIETVSALRASHTGGAAVDRALRDLDDRLSFAVLESRWEGEKSIKSLDWLTLQFHPPPLIAPLLTVLAQERYQRLWNLLLRLERVRLVLSSRFRSGSRDWHARHFVDCWASYVTEVGIQLPWNTFMRRLEDVQAQQDVEIKDVFSLARYHERVLDEMLETCLLKRKQRGIYRIVEEALQMVLDGVNVRNKVSKLVKALEMVCERAPGRNSQLHTSEDTGRGRRGEVDRELHRQQLEMEQDLQVLQADTFSTEAGYTAVAILLTRLNWSGYY